MSYYVMGFILLAVQVYFAVHAYRTGREWWIFFILFIPVVGALVYALVAWLPDVERQIQTSSFRLGDFNGWSRRDEYTRDSHTFGDSPALSRTASESTADKLRLLKEMLEEGLITEEDYERKKSEILSKL